MPFLQRHAEIMKKVGPISPFRLWVNTILFSWVIFGLCLGYLYLRGSGKVTTFNVNQAAANTSVFLIGFSFLLSSLCYFFDFLDTKIIYRKHLGIIGFAYGLAHVFFVVIVLQNMFPLNEWLTERLLTFSLGLVAVILFTFMTIISNQYVITHIGGKTWRTSLRWSGYIALVFVWFHAVIVTWPRWSGWLVKPQGWAPLGLIAAAFSVVVILARVILGVVLWRKSRSLKTAVDITA